MRFEDERYVRLYTRDTTTWLMLPWQSRSILPLILRKLDRAGLLDLGTYGVEALALMIHMPVEVVQPGLDAALARQILILREDGVLVWPKFIEGQEARQSDRARQKAARDRARDIASAETRGITIRDDTVTPRDVAVTKRDATVTPSHAPSHGVTPSCAVPSLAVPSLAEGVQGDPAPSAAGAAPAPLLEIQDPVPGKAKGREGPICMRHDWQPTPEHAASVRAKGLSVDRVVEDFRGHWVEHGARKTPANWSRTFMANVRRILQTDWLLERFRLTASEKSRASWPAVQPPKASGVDVTDAEADAALAEALAELEERTTPKLLREVQAEDVGRDVRLVTRPPTAEGA